jgi:hypothetical protein
MKRILTLFTALLVFSFGYSQTADEYVGSGNVKYISEDYIGAIAERLKLTQETEELTFSEVRLSTNWEITEGL